ncbi:GspH/FimT family pseudopilin [Rheinheimera sp.]|jgi:type IV fimbrial biogenesis protein FimT|uniref:GspH/FimT family pseudopilin n=1 Tax=Rheinheimera sp. TaxID=1869214 RepID=UPI00262D4798|nr:GspH/FimT family pseudopilin [Rheinheimera sp.]MCA1928877.1 GspH/FimT family pseudopilin [Rheinheimera sp.]
MDARPLLQWQKAFTLIELMISILVLLVLMAIAVPSFTELVARNRLSGQANELLSVIQLARSEAIKQNQTIRLCKANADLDTCSAASGSWTGWLVVDTASPATVIRAGRFDSRLTVSAGFTELRFSGQGLIRSQANQPLNSTFELCADGSQFTDNGRILSFLSGGRSSIQLSQCGS